MKVNLKDIKDAQAKLAGIIKETSISKSFSATKLLGSEIFFKFENEQLTGSFKIRGAYNKISSLNAEERKRGVVASSAGNHAQGVAHSSALAGVKSHIVMPIHAPLIKVNATKEYGGEVILHGEIYDDSYRKARELEAEQGYVFVHPYEDEKVIAGQGTIGLEIMQALPELDSIVIPIGGGGLISGIATAAKAINPKIKIIGVQSDQAPGMAELFHGEAPKERKRIMTIADGIAIKHPSKNMYDSFISKLVDEVVTVSDDEIADAIFFLIERAKSVTEGSGAAAMAAAMHRKIELGKKSCILLCGGNIDLNIVAKIIDQGLIRKGRLAEISVLGPDQPGLLSKLTAVIAGERANILQVHHDRVDRNLSLRETNIEFLLETTSFEHIERIKAALRAIDGLKIRN